jgi:hypothetical protein
MVDFKKYTGKGGKKAMEELHEKFKKDRKEYEMKIRKLTEVFHDGGLPDTAFVNSFIPRVAMKFKNNVLPLTPREKEVIDDMFDKF